MARAICFEEIEEISRCSQNVSTTTTKKKGSSILYFKIQSIATHVYIKHCGNTFMSMTNGKTAEKVLNWNKMNMWVTL